MYILITYICGHSTRALIIDPILQYSSYIGGSTGDYGAAIALDSSGNAYVTGNTLSSDFPRVNQIPGACQGTCGTGGGNYGLDVTDVFVTEINAAGSALVYSSYIGGSSYDYGIAIAVDSSGNAYVTGYTESIDFPIVNQIPGACQHGCGTGGVDVFITKINAAGSALVYSSLFGGNGYDQANAVAVDSSGNVYVTGYTFSSDFPIVNPIPGACQGYCGGGPYGNGYGDAFVTKINPAGSSLIYSSLLGGSSGDEATAVAVDSSGNVYVTGVTQSSDFPNPNQIQGACQGICGTSGDPWGWAFVTKFNAAGSALVYSSYIGGSSGDAALGIAVDGFGNAYVTGLTQSSDFPVVDQIPGACQGSCGTGNGADDGFVTKINAAGSALVYSSYVGGSGSDVGRGIAVDSSGNVYVTGDTFSSDFPTVNQIPGACQGSCGTGNDDNVFVTKINAAGSALVYSTYIGGSGGAAGAAIAVDSSGNAFVTGFTQSSDFPTVNQIPGACQGSCGTVGNGDVFVNKISPTANVGLSPTSLDFGPQGITRPTTPQIITLTNSGELPLPITGIAITGLNPGDFDQTNNCPMSPDTLAPGHQCMITVVFAPTETGTLTADVTITDNAPDSPQMVPLTGIGVGGRVGLK